MSQSAVEESGGGDGGSLARKSQKKEGQDGAKSAKFSTVY